jgi:hypothetical protein
LEVRVSSNPNSIHGGPGDGGYVTPSHVTIAVYNNLTVTSVPTPSRFREGGLFNVSGADVSLVLVRVHIPAPLSQLGNVRVPQGFTGAVSPDKHTFYCWGGPISAGGFVSIEIDVEGAQTCGEKAVLRTVVDPSGWVDEASETNNEATTEIYVWGIC